MVVKEGCLLLYDVKMMQWARVWAVMDDTALTLYSTSSRFSQIVHPAIMTKHVARVFSSLHTPEVPISQQCALGLVTHDNTALVFRTAACKTMLDWLVAVEKTIPVEHEPLLMLKPLIPKPLQLSLFREDPDAMALRVSPGSINVSPRGSSTATSQNASPARGFAAESGRSSGGAAPATLKKQPSKSPNRPQTRLQRQSSQVGGPPAAQHALSGPVTEPYRRVASLSADAPRRMLMKRSPFLAGAAPLATRRHADANASTSAATPTPATGKGPNTSRSPMPTRKSGVSPVPQRNGQHSARGPTTGGSVNSSFASAAEQPVAGRKSGSPDATPPTQRHFSNNTAKKTSATTTPADPPLSAPAEPVPTPDAVAAPAGKTTEEYEAEIAKLTQRLKTTTDKMDQFRRQNVELELESTNSSIRVLELEGEVSMLKGAASEWKRKHVSLESQLSVQEESFNFRMEADRTQLMNELKAQVQEEMRAMKAKWDAKEEEYLATIADLKAAALSNNNNNNN